MTTSKGQAKQAEKLWGQLKVLDMADACLPSKDTLAMEILSSALCEAYRDGVKTMQADCLEVSAEQGVLRFDAIANIASGILEDI